MCIWTIFGFVQGTQAVRLATRRTLFECLDSVFRPLAASDNLRRKEPNSTKKLAKGDGAWTTRKVMLGWVLDTVRRTIELPPTGWSVSTNSWSRYQATSAEPLAASGNNSSGKSAA